MIARHEEVTKLDPGVQSDWVELGRLYKAAGTLPGALRAAERAAETATNNRDRGVAFNEVGDVLVAQGDGPGALTAYRKGLAIAEALAARDPANAEWQRDLIVSLVKLTEATSDKTYVKRALEIALALQKRGALAPRDAWMIDDIKRRLNQ